MGGGGGGALDGDGTGWRRRDGLEEMDRFVYIGEIRELE